MLSFKCKPEIYQYKTVKDFINDFIVSKDDLVITLSFIYESVLKQLNLKCNYLFQDKCGIGEPTDTMIKTMFRYIENVEYKRVIAIGGGTVIDIAKLMTLPKVNSEIDLYALFKKEIKFEKVKELVIVPTTCGTGSEVTNISIVGFEEKNTKFGLAIEDLYANSAVLIEELFKTLPFNAFITSSIDALIHAIESYLAPKSNSYTELFSVEAIKIIINGYKQLDNKGIDYRSEIISDFIVASNYAGIAFGNTGVGAVHALSYPLSGKYHVAHGEANYQFLTEVLRTYNKLNNTGKILSLNKLLEDSLDSKGDKYNVYDKLDELLSKFLTKKPLNEYGMKDSEIESFSQTVIDTQQRLLNNNYVKFEKETMESIYRNLIYV